MTPDRILADVLAQPPARGFTTGPIRTLRPGPPRPRAGATEHTARVRRAVEAALDRYPGPVGQLVAAELLDYADQQWRGEPLGLSERLVARLLGEPCADEAPVG
ncbi:hypothetical protein [Pseudonocardia xishanensis]|uniref:Uncharacterized protein n=1 Tax=Pseudonocardia xishanensis TaxID=630995 RepID=A0ABP8S552_9PSEU